MIRGLVLLLLAPLIAGSISGSAAAADDTALRLANVSSGNTAYVRVANSAAFTPPAFTLEAWVQRVGSGYGGTTDGLGSAIIAKPIEGLTGSYIGSWHLNWTNSGQLVFTVVHTPGSSGVFLTAPAVATPLARHHLAATFDGDTLRAFVDGALAAKAGWGLGSVYSGPEDVLIGAQNFGAGYLRRFDGFIDDVRVWDHARSPAAIAAAMNCRMTGSETGLVAYWKFDASDLSDATGHGHVGAIGGLPGSLTYASLAPLSACATGVDSRPSADPPALLLSVFPQPTRGPVTVRFVLPRDGRATLGLYDVTGRRMGTLALQDYPAGRNEIAADVTRLGTLGQRSGPLFMRLEVDGLTATQPLVLLR